MIFIPETRKLIDELFPEYLAGKLNRETRHDDYIRLIKALNEVIREARKRRSARRPKTDLPAVFLLHHFSPLIERIVLSLLNKFPTLLKEAIRERKSDLKKTSMFGIYFTNAVEIFQTAVLGPNAPGSDKKQKGGIIGDSKYLDHSSLRVHIHRDRLLGKRKESKEPFHLRFIHPSPAAEYAAHEYAKRFKAYTPLQNPYFDEPAFFDPDYMKPEPRALIKDKRLADFALEEWRKGEVPEIKTEADCIAWIQSEFTAGIPLDKLDRRVQEAKDEADKKPPNFITWICGAGKKVGQRGFLYGRLRQMAYWHIKDEKRRKNAESSVQDVMSEEDSLDGTEMDELIFNDLDRDNKKRKKQNPTWNKSVDGLWNKDEITEISPVINVPFNKGNKKN